MNGLPEGSPFFLQEKSVKIGGGGYLGGFT